MRKIIRNSENALFVMFSIGLGTCFVIICIVVMLFQTCTHKPYDPLDYNQTREQRNVITVFVLESDSSQNGFEMTFRSKSEITLKTLKEMQSGRRIKEIETRFPGDARRHFGNIIETEIMEFARFGEDYVGNDGLTVKSIYECGKKREKLRQTSGSKLFGTPSSVDFSVNDSILKLF